MFHFRSLFLENRAIWIEIRRATFLVLLTLNHCVKSFSAIKFFFQNILKTVVLLWNIKALLSERLQVVSSPFLRLFTKQNKFYNDIVIINIGPRQFPWFRKVLLLSEKYEHSNCEHLNCSSGKLVNCKLNFGNKFGKTVSTKFKGCNGKCKKKQWHRKKESFLSNRFI